MPASNATFLAELEGGEVVYKPIAGERPLWDFPTGTLADREVAAYLVSEALGWDVVPRTWWGDGPHGPGMIQEWKVVDPDQDPVTLVAARPGASRAGSRVFDGVDDRDRDVTLVHEDTDALRRMAVFDVIVNNADRKGGHVLAMPDGHRYGVRPRRHASTTSRSCAPCSGDGPSTPLTGRRARRGVRRTRRRAERPGGAARLSTSPIWRSARWSGAAERLLARGRAPRPSERLAGDPLAAVLTPSGRVASPHATPGPPRADADVARGRAAGSDPRHRAPAAG